VKATITHANESERTILKKNLEGGRIYVLDQGYREWNLFQNIIDLQSSFVARVPNSTKYTIIEQRPLGQADKESRVIQDMIVRLGSKETKSKLKQHVRLLEIERIEEPNKRMREKWKKGKGPERKILIATDILDLSAELIALIYLARWKIEIFFRWLKCTMGFKHLMAETREGVALQIYSALIACLLISVWTGKRPTKRLYEAISMYLSGWASLEEVNQIVKKLKPHKTSSN
jgi:IS4 transposase